MKQQKTFRRVSLWFNLTGDENTSMWDENISLYVDGRDGYTGLYHRHTSRIPCCPVEINKLEIELLKLGAEIVKVEGRKFVRTRDIVGVYSYGNSKGIPYRHLEYKLK
jgi:hypothetical protein